MQAASSDSNGITIVITAVQKHWPEREYAPHALPEIHVRTGLIVWTRDLPLATYNHLCKVDQIILMP